MDLATPALDAESPAIDAPSAASPAPAPPANLAETATSLGARAREFARAPARDKAAAVRAAMARLVEMAPELSGRVARMRGIDPESNDAAEAWIAGPAAVIAYARQLAESLRDIAAQGRPALGSRDLVKRPDGRLVARLVPRAWASRAARRDRETYVLFTAGTEKEDVIAGQAAFYRGRDPEGGVALVVASATDAGAGMADALFSLFVQGHATLLLLPRQAAELAPLVERALGPMIERGWLRVAIGGEEEIAALGTRAAFSAVHHPAPGSVGPVIVTPNLYARDELAFLARRLVSELGHGAGLDPTSPRVIVISSSWPQRRMFQDMLGERLGALPPRSEYLNAGEPAPWTLVPALDPTIDEPLFSRTSGREMGVVALTSGDAEEHLAVAAAFCNERLAGSLAAEIVVHPVFEEDGAIGAAVERAAIALRYGAVGINQWPAVLRFDGAAPWGAHAAGFRNDPFMLPRVDKAILRGPLQPPRTPIFFLGDAGAATAARRLPAFEANPRAGHLFALAGR